LSRKKLKTKRRPRLGTAGSAARLLALDPGTRTRLWRGFGAVLVTCGLAVGIWAGLGRLEEKVHGLVRYDRELTLEWVGLPDWLRLEDNRHILDDLADRVGLSAEDRPLDPGLAERLGRSLSQPEVGWIKSVNRVVIRPDGVVSMRCQFRRPAAWVQHGGYSYLIDTEGVRLPGRYDIAECMESSLLMTMGVRLGPPEVGEIWRGGDVSSGLKVVSLLADRPFRHQIAGVIVANNGGRLDRSKPHIELATDREGSRIWWGRPPDEEFGTEITAAQKITLLQTLYRQWGRIDMNRAYVNIMIWPDKIAIPAVQRPSDSARLLRG
jgi:hypothetical protein